MTHPNNNPRLKKYRRILNAIHELGNIFNDKSRMAAYVLIALLASNERTASLQVTNG